MLLAGPGYSTDIVGQLPCCPSARPRSGRGDILSHGWRWPGDGRDGSAGRPPSVRHFSSPSSNRCSGVWVAAAGGDLSRRVNRHRLPRSLPPRTVSE